MTVENSTPNRSWPLPDEGNTLREDVARLILALLAADEDMQSALANLSAKADIESPTFSGEPEAPTAAPGTDSNQLATTAFVVAAIDALVNAAPGALDTLKELSQALGDDPDFAATMATQLGLKANSSDVAAALGDTWGLQPIGVPIPLLTNVDGVDEPPTTEGYRYIKLTASDDYNTGVLTSESVSGSAPELVATAVVDLTGSPLNGETIHLLNTMRVFLRPGSAGTVEGSQNRGHTHSGTTSPHSHSVPSKGREYYQGGGSVYGSTNGFNYSSSSDPMTTSSVSVAFTTDSSGGNEARPRNIGVTYYMRIK